MLPPVPPIILEHKVVDKPWQIEPGPVIFTAMVGPRVTVISAVAVHPLASVIVTVSVWVIGLMVQVLSLGVLMPGPLQVNLYPGVPPPPVAFRVPWVPTHIIEGPVTETVTAVGWVKVAVVLVVHPCASVTVTV